MTFKTMGIKDKLTARQVAMQMATDTMCAIVSQSTRYDVNDHCYIAKKLYDWIVGDAELPQVHNPDKQTEKLMDVFMKTHEDFKCDPLWFPIVRDNSGEPAPNMMSFLRDNCPIYIHDSKHTIIIGSKEEFDRRKQEIIDNADYTHYRYIIGDDMKYPIKRPLTLGIVGEK